MNNAKQNLLRIIGEVSFALDDVSLFLDTHPDNDEALSYYEKYKKARDQAVAEYESIYGPLRNYGVDSHNYWTWVNDPWPWEGEC